MKNIKNYTLESLTKELVRAGLPKYAAKQVFTWLYKRRVEDFFEMTDLSKKSREFLQKNFSLSKPVLSKEEVSSDGTRKFLAKMKDNSYIETVIIPEKGRYTVCVSSQVGCKYACEFCLSGKSGFVRNLNVSEIVDQLLMAIDIMYPARITNVVFMGIGEPLDNLSSVIGAIKIFTDPNGINLSAKRLSVSTSGLIGPMKKFLGLELGVNLSVSLHSADDKMRSKLMPVNRANPLSQLVKVLKDQAKNRRHPIIFEYVLIKGFNMDRDDAVKLAKLLKGMRCKVNLIPYNNSKSGYKTPSRTDVGNFIQALKDFRIFYTLRKAKGEDINAACGQLKALYNK